MLSYTHSVAGQEDSHWQALGHSASYSQLQSALLQLSTNKNRDFNKNPFINNLRPAMHFYQKKKQNKNQLLVAFTLPPKLTRGCLFALREAARRSRRAHALLPPRRGQAVPQGAVTAPASAEDAPVRSSPALSSPRVRGSDCF